MYSLNSMPHYFRNAVLSEAPAAKQSLVFCSTQAFAARSASAPQFSPSARRNQSTGSISGRRSENHMARQNSSFPHPPGKKLRSQLWFDNPDNPGMTAIYLE